MAAPVLAAMALGLGAAAGCGSRRAADRPLDGVECDDAGCVYQVTDRIFGPYPLVPGCVWEMAGVAPQQVTLLEDGHRLMVAGEITSPQGRPAADGSVGVLQLQLDAEAACPGIRRADAPDPALVHRAAHTATSGGEFLGFVGDATGSSLLIVHNIDGWSSQTPNLDAAPPDGAPVPAWSPPNAKVVRLAHQRALVVRTATQRDSLVPGDLALRLELFDVGVDPPARLAQAGLAAGQSPEVDALIGPRSQLRAFPVPDPVTANQPGPVVLMGQVGRGVSLQPDTLALAPLGDPRSASDPQPNRGAASVLLPLLLESPAYDPGALLFISGSSSPDDPASAEDLRRIDRFDPAAGGRWTPRVGMLPAPRMFAAPVLLPDGMIALIGGDIDDLRTLYVDPRRGFAATAGRARLSRPRGGAVTALLSVDGRVLVAGGLANRLTDEMDRAPPDLDILEPPYLDPARARPVIDEPRPQEITAEATFALTFAPEEPFPDEIVLLAFGSTLLGGDGGQRLVQLRIVGEDRASGEMAVMGPTAALAPAGRYLLFALHRRTPSRGIAVRVTNN
jgi:hypothetical protein